MRAARRIAAGSGGSAPPARGPGPAGAAALRMRGTARFIADERGAISIEFTTLVPFFIMFLVFFADATIIYLTHSEMFNVAREISRRMSTGELENSDDVQAYAADHLFLGSRDYYVGIDFLGDKTISIVVSVADAAIFGYFFKPILGKELVATATAAEEPRIE